MSRAAKAATAAALLKAQQQSDPNFVTLDRIPPVGKYVKTVDLESYARAARLKTAGKQDRAATEALFAATEFILTATSAEGCTGTDTVLVDVLLELDIPSGFTPNGDGINDRWNLGGLDQYPSAEITLFNRWGDVLLTFGSTDGVWDGTLNGIPVPVGTYYYHIRVNEPAMQAEWTGPITLMR